MELMAVLGAAAQPGIEAEVPDTHDPATAAAFTVLLAALVAPPPIATPTADPSPADAPAVAVVAAVAAESVDVELPAPAGHADPAPAGPTAPFPAGIEEAPAPAPTGVELDQPPTEPGRRAEVSPATTTGSVGALVDAAPLTVPAAPQAPPLTKPAAPQAPPATADILLGRPVPSPARPQAPASPATALVTTATSVGAATAAAATARHDGGGGGDNDEPTSAPRPAEPAEVTGAAAPALDEPARALPTGTSPHVTDAAPVPGVRPLERALATQLVERVGTLRHRDDGDYELTLQLDPADLGRLELRVRLEGGVVHVQVGAQAAGTTDLLRRALPELRDALVDAGLTTGALDIGPHTGQNDRPGAGGTRPDEPATSPDPAARSRPSPPVAPVPLPIRAGADRGVDVLL